MAANFHLCCASAETLVADLEMGQRGWCVASGRETELKASAISRRVSRLRFHELHLQLLQLAAEMPRGRRISARNRRTLAKRFTGSFAKLAATVIELVLWDCMSVLQDCVRLKPVLNCPESLNPGLPKTPGIVALLAGRIKHSSRQYSGSLTGKEILQDLNNTMVVQRKQKFRQRARKTPE